MGFKSREKARRRGYRRHTDPAPRLTPEEEIVELEKYNRRINIAAKVIGYGFLILVGLADVIIFYVKFIKSTQAPQ